MKRRKLRHTRRDLAISPRHHISSTTRYDIICTPGPQHRTYGESRVLGQNDPFFKLNVENGLIFKLLFKMTSFMPHQPIKSIFYTLFTLPFPVIPVLCSLPFCYLLCAIFYGALINNINSHR